MGSSHLSINKTILINTAHLKQYFQFSPVHNAHDELLEYYLHLFQNYVFGNCKAKALVVGYCSRKTWTL